MALTFSFVAHGYEAKSARRCARTRLRAVAGSQDLREATLRGLASTDPEERPHDPADHAAEERVRLDLEPEDLTLFAPARAAHRALPRNPRRERGEIVATHDPRARLTHRRSIERRREPLLPSPFERIARRRVPDPVFICPPRRPEPSVERLPRRLQNRDRDVLVEKCVEPSLHRASVQRARRPEVDHLSCRVHSGIGAPGPGNAHRPAADLDEHTLTFPR